MEVKGNNVSISLTPNLPHWVSSSVLMIHLPSYPRTGDGQSYVYRHYDKTCTGHPGGTHRRCWSSLSISFRPSCRSRRGGSTFPSGGVPSKILDLTKSLSSSTRDCGDVPYPPDPLTFPSKARRTRSNEVDGAVLWCQTLRIWCL